ncbi:cytochrome c1 [Benzoatithermus flavus]|uniref:Cytochrome c1 n=1 Tax=Benzoatithermus flavus TaxID=3108223 RepID=A0ABU8XQ94_9PROT
MANRLFAATVAAFAVTAGLVPSPTEAAEEGIVTRHLHWPTDGFFGSFDRAAVQRGFQVYREVCSACHSLKYVAFRNLADIGYDEEQIKAIAAQYQVTDGPNDQGEMFQRPGLPSDRIPGPYPNEQAAAAANGGKAPPDLSLMAKAREGGMDHIYSVLTGYEEPPADFTMPPSGYYNVAFPGHVIAMPPPLNPDQVTYADGTKATVAQMAQDVSQFLMWAAEPKLEARKQTGIKVILFLVVLTGLTFALKRKVWADVPH